MSKLLNILLFFGGFFMRYFENFEPVIGFQGIITICAGECAVIYIAKRFHSPAKLFSNILKINNFLKSIYTYT